MSSELQQFITVFAFFLVGAGFGYLIRLQQHADEVREWKAIARKAQMLNTLANSLREERRDRDIREYKN